MTTSMTIRQAAAAIKSLHKSLDHWIGESKKRHGVWVEAHKTTNMALRDKTYKAWQAAVKQAAEITHQINTLEAYVKDGATVASLDIAKSIAVWEGGASSDGLFRPYQDPVGVWTIGYGHTNADGPPHVDPSTHSLTRAEATTLLLHDLNVGYVPAVRNALHGYGWKVNQKMFDALVSFAYNLGPGYFLRGNTMGNAMATKNAGQTGNAMLQYDHAGGQVLLGLKRRREWERQLFLGGTYTVN